MRSFGELGFYKHLVPARTRTSSHAIARGFVNREQSSDATLPTVSDLLRPAHQSSNPEPTQFSETPSRREYFRSAPAPSACVRCPTRCRRGVEFRRPARPGKNRIARARFLPTCPEL